MPARSPARGSLFRLILTLALVTALGGLVSSAKAAAAGSIKIHCVPLAGVVSIPGLTGLEIGGGNLWEFAPVAPGTYEATLSSRAKPVVLSLQVTEGAATEVTVNLFNGSVQPGPPGAARANAPQTAKSKASPPARANKAIPPPATRFTIPDLGLTMIVVSPGNFTYGSDTAGKMERPAVPATITQRFWLGQTEVTQAQWTRLMGANPSEVKGAELPVASVSWNEATEFCRRLTARERPAGRLPANYVYRLPLEVQWEYACRAGSEREDIASLDLTDWFTGNSGNAPQPVARKEPNAWGFYDMRGNVAEWCHDWFAPHATAAVDERSGPATGETRALRGGTFRFEAKSCRATLRMSETPDHGHSNAGFRLALIEQPAAR